MCVSVSDSKGPATLFKGAFRGFRVSFENDEQFLTKILHDPECLLPCEIWFSGLLRSNTIFFVDSMTRAGKTILVHPKA